MPTFTRSAVPLLPLKGLLSAGLIMLALALCVPAAAPAAEPGLSPDLTWGTSNADQDRTGAALRDVGSHWVRLNIEWSALETAPDTYDSWQLRHYDRAVDVARASGQRIMMLVSTSPRWASGSADKQSPPSDPAQLADFLHYAVARWKGKIDAWQVWNEPNIARFWPQGPNPASYAALLAAAHPAIKAEDPGAQVVFGGTSLNDYAFVEGAYAAGAKGNFDVMAVHPYSCAPPDSVQRGADGRIRPDSFAGYREVRASMLARGDDKPIWLTEWGWSTTGGPCGVSEATQADYVKRTFRMLDRDPYVQVAFYYNLRNNYWMHDADETEARYGLMRTDFSPKPAYHAFKAAAAGLRDPDPAGPEATAVNVAPVVALTGPRAGRAFRRTLQLSARASDDQRVSRVEFWLDGRLIATDTSAPYRHRVKLRGRRAVAARRHILRARAIDDEGLSDSHSIKVRRKRIVSASGSRRGGLRAVRGRVRGASSGWVVLHLQRRAGRRWRAVADRRARLHGGSFRSRIRVPRGTWRVRAVYVGAPGRGASQSGFLSFKG